ncbi:ATP-binding response regulator [Limnoraphis robusta]|uniref:Histidine kinase n=1 Tax=Limnoraphis robusta CS-951 TaxID=1637645 RepID=A0A0F5YG35_9CYAN|nr:response regulator [Limnoraphis robusta]KKD37587.1 histidine kinase [Limnoraphis robusta CS-951]
MNNNLNLDDKETILIIDDCPDNLHLLSEILSHAGYKVHLAPSGKLALKFIELNLPDLILLDIMMPQMDGYTVFEQFKKAEEHKDIPVIFISALHDVFDKVKAFSLGGVDYITKPFKEQEVLVRVENQLRLRRLSQQLIEKNILEERNRMAREIHDVLAQAFTGIILNLGAAERAMEKTPDQAVSHLKTVRELAKTGLAEARRSVTALRPQLLENGDLYSALNLIATRMSSHSQTRIVLEVMGTVDSLPLEVENNLLRIAQEALTNAFKYAKASTINIELIYEPEQFSLRVQDNGQGFDVESPCFLNGFGFLGMKERADRIHAQLMITSEVGRGTEIRVSVQR